MQSGLSSEQGRLVRVLFVRISQMPADAALQLELRHKPVRYNAAMPLRLIRFLAVAIALVLPIQGIAAVTAAQCMALSHHQDAAGHAGHGEAKGAESGHDHSMHSHDESAGSAASDEADKGSHCGPCTACCASASIAGPAGLSILSRASTAPCVFSQFAPPSVPLDGLDRPPTAL